MKYKKIRIQNYKAIKDLTIDFKNRSLIPLIGLNETGKSSILEAIFSFDKMNDKFNNGKHLERDNIGNKYEVVQKDAEITAIIEIKNDEVEDVLKKFLSLRNKNTKKIIEEIKEKEEIEIRRNLISKSYNLNLEVSEKIKEKIIEEILENLQYSIYIDDFNDRIPKYITKDSDWYRYIRKLFEMTSETYTMELFENSDLDKQKNILSDVNFRVNEDIMDIWDNIMRGFIDKNEIESSKIEIEYEKEKGFRIIVNDRSTNKNRIFDISDRSKGFQWFLNFVIKLKYNHKYLNDKEGALFLLDEPGSYLHSSGQKELLKKLKELSQNNTILYTTHLESLVDISIINPKNIEIVKRKAEKITLENFSFSKDIKENGSYTPILNALKISTFPVDFYNKKIILTEGITEYYFLKLLIEKVNLLEKDIKIIPGYGVNQLSNLISLAVGLGNKYTILFDNDEAGNSAFQKYKEKFVGEEGKWIIYDIEDIKLLEDFYSDKMIDIISKYGSNSNLKNGIVNFYYEFDEKDMREFGKECKNNIKIKELVEKINEKLKI